MRNLCKLANNKNEILLMKKVLRNHRLARDVINSMNGITSA